MNGPCVSLNNLCLWMNWSAPSKVIWCVFRLVGVYCLLMPLQQRWSSLSWMIFVIYILFVFFDLADGFCWCWSFGFHCLFHLTPWFSSGDLLPFAVLYLASCWVFCSPLCISSAVIPSLTWKDRLVTYWDPDPGLMVNIWLPFSLIADSPSLLFILQQITLYFRLKCSFRWPFSGTEPCDHIWSGEE